MISDQDADKEGLMLQSADVVVVGAGNAGLCAALAARDAGAEVLVLERAPRAARGGNSAFTGGVMRFAYRDASDLKALVPTLSDAELEDTDFGSYSEDVFYADIARVTEHRADPDLADLLVSRSNETLRWMADKGVPFTPTYGRQAFRVDGKLRFWGGVPIEVSGGGVGLVDALFAAAEKAGIHIEYEARAKSLIADDDGIHGVRGRGAEGSFEVRAGAVILAAGGFQANAEMRTKYLGPGWDLAKVRGTRYDTGDGIQMALDAGAASRGHWSGCHSVGWDLNAPAFGDIAVGDGFNKHNYQFGIMVNATGERFLDEGADIRNYTYAKYGRVILAQPGQFAWQVFDAKVAHLLRPEFYRRREVTKATGNTLEELAGRLEGVNPERFLDTVRDFNAAVQQSVPFNPTTKDGRGTTGLTMPKSNWANTLDEPPYEAFAVTCGVSFTFGGVHVDDTGQVIDSDGHEMPGLWACGEMAGGLFYFNYPGGTGLTWGSVLGRIAGSAAGSHGSDARM
jgi:tricarballylate dehydrogenase